MPTSSELYKRTRNWENVQLATFINKAGKFDIPKMVPVTECDVKNWIGFNFARNGGYPTGYGNHTMVAVINPALAKPISVSQLQTKAAQFAQTHPKFARAVGGFNTNFNNNNMSIWALAMGYNVITGSSRSDTRTNIIDRSVLVYKK